MRQTRRIREKALHLAATIYSIEEGYAMNSPYSFYDRFVSYMNQTTNLADIFGSGSVINLNKNSYAYFDQSFWEYVLGLMPKENVIYDELSLTPLWMKYGADERLQEHIHRDLKDVVYTINFYNYEYKPNIEDKYLTATKVSQKEIEDCLISIQNLITKLYDMQSITCLTMMHKVADIQANIRESYQQMHRVSNYEEVNALEEAIEKKYAVLREVSCVLCNIKVTNDINNAKMLESILTMLD